MLACEDHLDRDLAASNYLPNSDLYDETQRVVSIVESYDDASIAVRHEIIECLTLHITYSQNPYWIIEEVIRACILLRSSHRLDLAIALLAATGSKIRLVEYANYRLSQDIEAWDKTNPTKKFQPNDDYWYVLLRAVAQCSADKPDKSGALRLLSACQDEKHSLGVCEGVIEGLNDLGTPEAYRILKNIAESHSVEFVRKLAKDVLEDCE